MHAEYGVGQRHHPVEQRRFVEVRFALQRRHDPLAACQHLERNLRVASLVRLEQGKAHPREQQHARQRRDDEERRPTPSCGPFASARKQHAPPQKGQPAECRLWQKFVTVGPPTLPHRACLERFAQPLERWGICFQDRRLHSASLIPKGLTTRIRRVASPIVARRAPGCQRGLRRDACLAFAGFVLAGADQVRQDGEIAGRLGGVNIMRARVLSASLLLVLVFLGVVRSGDSKKPQIKLTADEEKLLELTNAERKKEDLPPLAANLSLCRVARAHSQNMAKQEKLDHVLDCKSPFDRLDDAKYRYQSGAENIAVSAEQNPSMADILKLWMDSDPHRKNILSAKFTEVGVGIAKNDKGEVYCTEIFAAPLKK